MTETPSPGKPDDLAERLRGWTRDMWTVSGVDDDDRELLEEAASLIQDQGKEIERRDAVVAAWQSVFEGLEAHLQDRIAMKDPANPEAYLSILRSSVARVQRDSEQIVASRWADARRARERIEALEAKLGEEDGYTAEQQRVADYIVSLTGIGGGDDPVGFILASHAVMSARALTAERSLEEIQADFDGLRAAHEHMRARLEEMTKERDGLRRIARLAVGLSDVVRSCITPAPGPHVLVLSSGERIEGEAADALWTVGEAITGLANDARAALEGGQDRRLAAVAVSLGGEGKEGDSSSVAGLPCPQMDTPTPRSGGGEG